MKQIKRILRKELRMWTDEWFLFKSDMIRLKNYMLRKWGMRNQEDPKFYVRFH